MYMKGFTQYSNIPMSAWIGRPLGRNWLALVKGIAIGMNGGGPAGEVFAKPMVKSLSHFVAGTVVA